MIDVLENQLLVQLYSKLAASLSVPGTVGHDNSSILSLQLPGLYIRPNLDPQDPENQYYIANSLDMVLACDSTVVRKTGTVSSIYKSILDGKETPIVHLDPERLHELEKARNFLFDDDGDPTEIYRNYSSCQLAWLEAQDSYEAALATHSNGGPDVPEQLVERLEAAGMAWKEQGHRTEVERALAIIAEYESYEPELFWRRLSERFARYTRRAGVSSEFQLIQPNPPYAHWFQQFGWSSFKFDMKDFRNQSRSGGLDAGSCRCCCERCQAASSTCPSKVTSTRSFSILGCRSSTERNGSTDFQDFTLECSLRRIEIVRPWMDSNVFYSRAWRWSRCSVSYGVTLSTGGDLAGRVIPSGVMPVLPSSAILARDLKIHWKDGTAMQEVRNRLSDGEELHLGPFRLSRSMLDDDHRIDQPDPQLIGFIGTILPMCPNPDPTLPWPEPYRAHDEWP